MYRLPFIPGLHLSELFANVCCSVSSMRSCWDCGAEGEGHPEDSGEQHRPQCIAPCRVDAATKNMPADPDMPSLKEVLPSVDAEKWTGALGECCRVERARLVRQEMSCGFGL